MSEFHTINVADVAGQRLVVRADLNAPVQDGKVSDATRITRFAAGIKPLLAAGARITVLSHFGRPKGVRNMDFTIAPIVPVLAEALGCPVNFIDDCTGDAAVAASNA